MKFGQIGRTPTSHGIQHAEFNSRNPTCEIQLKANNTQNSTHRIQHTELNSRNPTHGIQHAEFNSRKTTLLIQLTCCE